MTDPIDLNGPPLCVECGTPMVVTEHPGEGDGGDSMWSAACWAGLADDRHPEWVDLTERPTLRDQPGAQALVTEIERLRAERQAAIAASPAAKVRETFRHLAFTDADLVRLAIERAGHGEYRRQRWAVVGEIFARGSHVARELCRAVGLNPEEMVGDDGEIEDIIGEDGGGGE